MLHYRLPSVFAFITHFTFNAVPKHFRRIPKYSDAFQVHSTSLFKVFILHSDLIIPPFPVESYLGVISALIPLFSRISESHQRSIPSSVVSWRLRSVPFPVRSYIGVMSLPQHHPTTPAAPERPYYRRTEIYRISDHTPVNGDVLFFFYYLSDLDIFFYYLSDLHFFFYYLSDIDFHRSISYSLRFLL